MPVILDGKKIAQEIRDELKSEIAALKKAGVIPGLAVILMGENPASQVYVKMKTKAADELGINSETIAPSADTTETELLDLIHKLNQDDRVHGILVQLPLPKHIDETKVITALDPKKDVDGFHPVNRGKLIVGQDTFVPCTPLGIQEMLVRSGVIIKGKHVVIVGRSNIVGLPLASILVQKKENANATVTVCHTGTGDLSRFTLQADILIAAIGKPEVINGSMIKKDAVVVDVGINRVEDPSSEKGYRLVGDVHFKQACEVASVITPVPGGVGPLTIAMLMHNTVKAAKCKMKSEK